MSDVPAVTEQCAISPYDQKMTSSPNLRPDSDSDSDSDTYTD